MKNMTLKKIILLLIVVIFASCEKDESLDPRPLVVAGQYISINFTKRILNFDNITDTYLGGTITAPGNNVKKFVLKIKRRNASIFNADYAVIPLDISSFPYELKLTPDLIATSLGLQVADLKSNDYYFFDGESTGFDEKVINYNNLSAVIKSQSSMKQGYRFQTVFQTGQGYLDNILTWDNFDLSK